MALDLKRLAKQIDRQLACETYMSIARWGKKKGIVTPHLGNTNFGFKKEDFK